MNEAAVLGQGPSIVGTVAHTALHLLLGILVQQVHEAARVLGACDDHLLLDWCILLARRRATLVLLSLLTILVLALLSVALETGEGLRQILQGKVLQEHSQTHAYVGGARNALGTSACTERLSVMHGGGPLHKGFPKVWIVQVLLEKTLKVLPNVDVDLLALPQVLDLLLENHGLHLVFLKSWWRTILAIFLCLGLTCFNLGPMQSSLGRLAR